MENNKLLVPPPIHFIIVLIGVILFGYSYPTLKIINFPFSILGILISILGLFIALSAGNLFRKNKTTILPNKKSRKLVINGVYRFSRNPMYLGAFFVLFGLAFYFGDLISILISFIFPILMNFIVIPFEEKVLIRDFGKEYNRYKLTVRRWI